MARFEVMFPQIAIPPDPRHIVGRERNALIYEKSERLLIVHKPYRLEEGQSRSALFPMCQKQTSEKGGLSVFTFEMLNVESDRWH